jgi:hypothetical protein
MPKRHQMERFSADFRGKYRHNDHLDGIERGHDRLRELRRDRIHFPTVIPGLIEPLKVPNNPAHVLVFMQTAIRRGLELTNSMIRDANAFSYTPVWVSSRSLFELGSLVFDLSDNVSDLVAGWDFGRYLEFETHLAKIMLDFKSTTWHPGLDESEHLVLVPQNILTIIQRIEKRHIPGFCGLYALLSEAAHPNYTGMMEQYHTLDLHATTAEFHDRPAERDIALIEVPLANAEAALVMLGDAIESYESNLTEYALLYMKNTGGRRRPGRA